MVLLLACLLGVAVKDVGADADAFVAVAAEHRCFLGLAELQGERIADEVAVEDAEGHVLKADAPEPDVVGQVDWDPRVLNQSELRNFIKLIIKIEFNIFSLSNHFLRISNQ